MADIDRETIEGQPTQSKAQLTASDDGAAQEQMIISSRWVKVNTEMSGLKFPDWWESIHQCSKALREE